MATYNTDASFPAYVGELKNVTVRACDLRDEEKVRQVMVEYKDFDNCAYLASDTRVAYLTTDQPSDVKNNILPMANFAKHYSGGPTIFFSSGSVYMGQVGAVSHATIHPSIPYSISKFAQELYLEHAAKLSGYAIVRFFGAYGPHEAERKVTNRLLLAIDSAGDEVEFTVYGDGGNLIDVMYVDDTINAIQGILGSKKRNVTVDLCGGSALPINEFVQTIVRAFGKKAKIMHTGVSPEYVQFRASTEGFKREFGYSPTTSLEEGARKYMDWLRKTARSTREVALR